ncbi:MAG: hypothetical protein ACFB22_07370 [Rhodothalassiaceae bacterium]
MTPTRPALASSPDPTPRVDIFIGAPMSGFADAAAYEHSRSTILDLVKSLRADGRTVYYAGETIATAEGFSGPQAAAEQDFRALAGAAAFVMIYPGRIASSVLVEIGFAFARGIPCLILANRRADLPYSLIESEKLGGRGILPPIEIVELTLGAGSTLKAAEEIARFTAQQARP